MGQQFAHRERGSYGDWNPQAAWDAPDISRILDVRATPDARSVLGARAVSQDRTVTASRRQSPRKGGVLSAGSPAGGADSHKEEGTT